MALYSLGMVALMRSLAGSVEARVSLFLALAVVALTGCGAPATSLVPIGPGIAVPADALRPVDRCLFDAGFRATNVHRGRVGWNAVYSWELGDLVHLGRSRPEGHPHGDG